MPDQISRALIFRQEPAAFARPDTRKRKGQIITPLPLTTREGLPDALKVLLAAYPRAGWTQDPGFDDLIRFWLDRHLMFRRLTANLTETTQAMQDKAIDPKRFAASLSRFGGHLVNGLHEHHTIEDTYYFPQLSRHDPRITSGFDMLEADHHALDAALGGFVGDANVALQAIQNGGAVRDTTGALADRLDHLTRLLDRHLTDEEDLIVPVLLKFGGPKIG